MDDRIYFISQYDNKIHNVNDVDHIIVDENNAEVGEWTPDGLRVDEEVTLYTLREVYKFY